MFINHSNHPSAQWDDLQRRTAESYGSIVDMPFPSVAPESTTAEVQQLVEQYGNSIVEKNPTIVMVQGEFTYTYRLVEFLKERQIRVVAATSDRIVNTLDDGKTKQVTFNFVQFREF